MADVENVIIIGSGPAGYTAALYTSRANLNPLVIEGFMWGGLLQQTTDVENYPGFPEGIMGPELMQKFRDQAERFGDAVHHRPGDLRRAVRRAGRDPQGPRRQRRLPGAHGDPRDGRRAQEARRAGEEELAGARHQLLRDLRRGVLQGPGDHGRGRRRLARWRRRCSSPSSARKVLLVHRRDEFRASKIMIERARAMDNIEFKTPYVVEAFLEGEGPFKRIARLKQSRHRRDRGRRDRRRVHRHRPRAAVRDRRRPGRASTTRATCKTDGKSTRTDKPGVFAAGDLVDHTYRQAITAAGSGCQAALDAEWYLRDTPQIPTPEGLPEGDLAEAQWAAPQA